MYVPGGDQVLAAASPVLACEFLDAGGNPTVEVEVWLEDGARGRAAVPSPLRIAMDFAMSA